jgi:hypothetical protein
VLILQGTDSVGSIRIAERDRRSRHLWNKFHISNNLRTFRRTTYLIFAASLAAGSRSELLDGWSPQTFLAEKIITIVTYFRLQVVKFIFGGRNSGQSRDEEDRPLHTMSTDGRGGQESDSKALIRGLWIMNYHIFRDRKYALLPVKFDPVRGIGRELDFTRFSSQSGHHISKGTTSL